MTLKLVGGSKSGTFVWQLGKTIHLVLFLPLKMKRHWRTPQVPIHSEPNLLTEPQLYCQLWNCVKWVQTLISSIIFDTSLSTPDSVLLSLSKDWVKFLLIMSFFLKSFKHLKPGCCLCRECVCVCTLFGCWQDGSRAAKTFEQTDSDSRFNWLSLVLF